MAPVPTSLIFFVVAQSLSFAIVFCEAHAPPVRLHRSGGGSQALIRRAKVYHTVRPSGSVVSEHGGLRRRHAALMRKFQGHQRDSDSTKDPAFLQTRKQQDYVTSWLSARACMKICDIDLKAWDDVKNACKTKCMASLDRLVQASHRVYPGEHQHIQFPSSAMHRHPANDGTEYNGMMFAGGVTVGGNTTFVARLCTHNCHVGDPYYDSTLVMGELGPPNESPHEGLHSVVSLPWKHAAEHWVPHDDGQMAKGDYVGPEDPRMDVLLGSRFLTVGMNVPSKKAGCGPNKVGIHHMFFVPVDKRDGFKSCDIPHPGGDNCAVQKNWASLVPRGSEDFFYVYAVRPLQVFHFQPKSCKTSWADASDTLNHRPRHFDPKYHVHGGTRYVFGGQVADGDLFWSVGHTPPPLYMPVLIALLMRNATAGRPKPSFELLGVSCPINVSMPIVDSKHGRLHGWADNMLITTSIVDFDAKADTSRITFQVQDKDNYASNLIGVGAWINTVYEEYKGGHTLSCDQAHGG